MSEREELEAVIETAVNKALDVAGQTGGFPPFRERIATALLSSGYAKGNGRLMKTVQRAIDCHGAARNASEDTQRSDSEATTTRTD